MEEEIAIIIDALAMWIELPTTSKTGAMYMPSGSGGWLIPCARR